MANGKLYGASAPLSQTFNFQECAPIDDRVAVKTKLDLANLNAYKGLLVYVEDENSYYSYKQNETTRQYTWQEATFGTSDSSEGGSVPAVFLETIRSLLAEVLKLRNSFLYGIDSYLGTDTAQGRVLAGYLETIDKEPLWAISEDDLLIIDDLIEPLNSTTSLEAIDSTIDTTVDGKLGIVKAKWVDPNVLKENTHSKQLTYLASSKDTITLTLECKDEVGQKVISLQGLTGQISANSLHYMIIVSQLQGIKGSNYLYISIDNNENGLNLKHGYYANGLLVTLPTPLDKKYYLKEILFENLDLTKLNFYTKYQDFSNETIPSPPKDQEYKYRAAHITVREVENEEQLETIKTHLLQPELVWVASTHSLKINTSEGLITIGASTNENENQITMQAVKTALEDLGIILNVDEHLEISNIESLSFINNLGKTYEISVDSDGKIATFTEPTEKLQSMIPDDTYAYPSKSSTSAKFKDDYNRGFAAKVLYKAANATYAVDGDWKLCADRIKIGAVYMAFNSENPSCTHAYVELENTSDRAFPLDGCALAYTYPEKVNDTTVQRRIVLNLRGTIPAGGTYLIRGKKYTSNALINVASYDIEWPELNTAVDRTLTGDIGFLLYYNDSTVNLDTLVYTALNDTTATTKYGDKASTNPYEYEWYYIDSVGLAVSPLGKQWFPDVFFAKIEADSIYKNVFELDPAKQAFLALTVKDSSRARNTKKSDYLTVTLSSDQIKFPKSFDTYAVTNYTPKASYLNKNVSTDKTKLDMNKPNMVTCSFGINIHTTRCFNWISAGLYNEFVFIKNGNTWERFESYGGNNNDSAKTWAKVSLTGSVLNAIYSRMTGNFPADNTSYTAHKCIVKLATAPTEKTTYTYVVGRAGADGNPDPNHTSEEYTFTVYPTSVKPRIYQITDQQGFTWIEYLVWAAAALQLNAKIEADLTEEEFIPVLINTGDMTQNGSRINEWLDYYNAGKSLFKHLEQMNCVGNNDLCNVNHANLGTGDDPGKSNPYYFHLCYCYEQPDADKFIINGKYVPSTYYFGNDNYKFLILNSELTYTACNSLYGLGDSTKTINIYTGYEVYKDLDTELTYAPGEITPIYNTIYSWLSLNCTTVPTLNSNWIVACHEMPFTVITLANLKTATKGVYRSISGTNLVGSHLNQLNLKDVKGTHWLSRLMEYFHMPLCIGGHKHTYMCSFPLRENFTWSNGTKNSATEQYVMPVNLSTDNISWMSGESNTSKLPLIKDILEIPSATDKIYPGVKYTGNLNTVTYFMCQATGYKLKSNKELPSYALIFSKVAAGNGLSDSSTSTSETALVSLLYPMFGIIYPDTYKVKLARILNILKMTSSNAEKFSQYDYATAACVLQYLNGDGINLTQVLDNSAEVYNGVNSTSSVWTTANYLWNTNSANYLV